MARKTLAEIFDGKTRFGRLTVVREAEPSYSRAGVIVRHAIFRCDCGEERRIRVASVRSGATKSCGCLHRETAAKLADATALRHGDARAGSRAPEYLIYRAMLNRCYNPKVDRYPEYGGRGISVCDEWRGDGGYERFLSHIGRRPSEEHSIDRKDPDDHYRPGNVRWAVKEVQANNKRNSVRIRVGDKDMTLREMSEQSGLGIPTIRYRLKQGLSPEAAMTEPVKTGLYAKA